MYMYSGRSRSTSWSSVGAHRKGQSLVHTAVLHSTQLGCKAHLVRTTVRQDKVWCEDPGKSDNSLVTTHTLPMQNQRHQPDLADVLPALCRCIAFA